MRFQPLAVLGAISLLIAAGCQRGDPLAFNNAIVNANKKLEQKGEAFGDTAGLVFNGNASVSQLKRVYQDVLDTLAEIRTEMAALSVPSSDSAKRLHAAHKKFLDGQERTIKEDFAEIVRIIEDKSLNRAQKKIKIDEIILRCERAEQADLTPLKSAQRQFAKEHNVKLQ